LYTSHQCQPCIGKPDCKERYTKIIVSTVEVEIWAELLRMEGGMSPVMALNCIAIVGVILVYLWWSEIQ